MPYFERKTWQETARSRAKPDLPDLEQNMSFEALAQSIINAESERQYSQYGPFRCKTLVFSGGTGVIGISVAADHGVAPLSLNLVQGDLRSVSGQIIPARFLSLKPNVLMVSPGQNECFDVRLKVPDQATPGLYAGRVDGHGPEAVSFVVEFEVVANPTN